MTENSSRKIECHRLTTVRTEAIMAAVMTMRDALSKEEQFSRVGSAYSTIRSVVYDMVEGAYLEGYSTGEDDASCRQQDKDDVTTGKGEK